MPENAVVRARIDEKTKKKATLVLKSMGMTPSIAFRMMMMRIAADKELPFEIRTPNDATVAAMEELRRGGGTTVANVDELFRELNAKR